MCIGKNSSGAKTVGFRISSYIEGSIAVESVENLPHIPDKMKLAAKVFKDKFEFNLLVQLFQFYSIFFRRSYSKHMCKIQNLMCSIRNFIPDNFDSLPFGIRRQPMKLC